METGKMVGACRQVTVPAIRPDHQGGSAMNLKPKAAQLLAMASMVFIMTAVVVFISTLVNFGLAEDFTFRFLRGWGIAFLLAFPLVVLLMPRLQKLFQGMVRK
jgi:hypothetical protein